MLPRLCLSVFLTHVAMPAPILTGPQQAAPQEEVNLLFYGVQQFGEALRHLHDATAQKLDKVRHLTDRNEQGLRVLHHQAQSAHQHQKEIRGIIEGLKVEDVVLREQSQSHQEALQKVHAGYHHLAQRVKVFEEALGSLAKRGFQRKKWGFGALKAHVQHQNLTIWPLLGAIQQQQHQMAQQLLWLQEQMKDHRDAKPNVGQRRRCKIRAKEREGIAIFGAESHHVSPLKVTGAL